MVIYTKLKAIRSGSNKIIYINSYYSKSEIFSCNYSEAMHFNENDALKMKKDLEESNNRMNKLFIRKF